MRIIVSRLIFMITFMLALNITVGLCADPATDNPMPSSKAKWVWYPEDSTKDAIGQTRYFRKIITLDSEVKQAKLFITSDDSYSLTVNGQQSAPMPEYGNACTKLWKCVACHDITAMLKKGDNSLSLTVKNGTSVAGLILRGEIVSTKDNKNISLYSDETWKCAKTADKSWERADFNDNTWKHAKILGGVDCSPWAEHGFDFHLLLDENEQSIYTAWENKRKILMDLSNIDFGAEKAPYAKITYKGDQAFIDINGKLIPPYMYINQRYLTNDFNKHQVQNFIDAGTPITVVDLHSCLKQSGTDNNATVYKSVDERIRRHIKMNPKGYLFVGFYLNAPAWWLKSNPDELIGYATGEPVANTKQGRTCAASMASTKWRSFMKNRMVEVIRYIARQPWSNRVIGYRFMYGVNGEWHYYGMRDSIPDTGPAMTKRFRKWLAQKYGNKQEALRAAWHDATINFKTVTVPSEKERRKSGCLSLRTPLTDQKVLDYYQCHQDTVSEAILDFAKTIKEEVQNRLLVGVYYGYFFGMPYPPEGFQINMKKLLSSPYIDSLSAPYDYDWRSRSAGGDGLCRSLPDIFRLYGKLHLMEDDTFTNLSKTPSHRRIGTEEETISVLKRQICGSIFRGYGIQYIEFSNPKDKFGWFDSPEIMKTIKQGIEFYVKAGQFPKKSSSQICVVLSPKNIMYMGYPSRPVHQSFNLLTGVVHELSRTGAPFDVITLQDLQNPMLPEYRFYIFLNSFHLSIKERESIEKMIKRDDKVALWLYASGAITEKGMSDDAISSLTGITIKRVDEQTHQVVEVVNNNHLLTSGLAKNDMRFPVKSKHLLIPKEGPIFNIIDKDAVTLGVHDKTKEAALSVKNFKSWTSIYCAVPFISRAILKNCLKLAKVHQYLDGGDDIVYARLPFLMIHTKTGGKRKILLPQKASTVTSMFDNKIIGHNVKELSYDFAENSTVLLMINP